MTPQEKTEKFIKSFIKDLTEVYNFVDKSTKALFEVTRSLSYKENLQILAKSPMEPYRSRSTEEIKDLLNKETEQSIDESGESYQRPDLTLVVKNYVYAKYAANEVKRLLFFEIFGNAHFMEGNCTATPMNVLTKKQTNNLRLLLTNPLNYLSKNGPNRDISPGSFRKLVEKIKEIKLNWVCQQNKIQGSQEDLYLKKLLTILSRHSVRDDSSELIEKIEKIACKRAQKREEFSVQRLLSFLVKNLPDENKYIDPVNPKNLVETIKRITPNFVYETDEEHNISQIFSEKKVEKGALVIIVMKKDCSDKKGTKEKQKKDVVTPGSPNNMTSGHMVVCSGFDKQTGEPLFISFDHERINVKLSPMRQLCGYVINLPKIIETEYTAQQEAFIKKNVGKIM